MDDENTNKLLIDFLRRLNGEKDTVKPLTNIGTKELLNTSDVMALFNVCERTVQRWRKKGKIKKVNICGRYYYHQEDVDIMMQARS